MRLKVNQFVALTFVLFGLLACDKEQEQPIQQRSSTNVTPRYYLELEATNDAEFRVAQEVDTDGKPLNPFLEDRDIRVLLAVQRTNAARVPEGGIKKQVIMMKPVPNTTNRLRYSDHIDLPEGTLVSHTNIRISAIILGRMGRDLRCG